MTVSSEGIGVFVAGVMIISDGSVGGKYLKKFYLNNPKQQHCPLSAVIFCPDRTIEILLNIFYKCFVPIGTPYQENIVADQTFHKIV